MDYEQRSADAEKHLELMKVAFSHETDMSIEQAVIYEEGQGRGLPLPEPSYDSTQSFVTTLFAPTALRYSRGETAIVDPASFMRAGGRYKEGGFGTEQILCSRSNLYLILQGLRKSYFSANRGYYRGQLFTDRALYIPQVIFLKNARGERSIDNTCRSNVIVISAPNRKRALASQRSERECDHCIETRIETIFHIAAANKCETLITCALGCGREGYDPTQIASIYKKWVDEHPGIFSRIIYSVPNKFAESFSEVIGREPLQGKKKPSRTKASSNDGEGTDNTDGARNDFHGIKLPEGVTVR